MTERLYYTDSYLREFTARAVERSGDGLTVYLDRTAFYPESGGQPSDRGLIAGAEVLDVVDEGDRIAHRLATPAPSDLELACSVDWTRRFDHMQQHTGQHVLSAVLDSSFGLRTVSFHMGAEACTIDLEGGAVDGARLREAERIANEIVCENRPVHIGFDEAENATGLRKSSSREGTLRIVNIEDLDRNACGGTHVRSTGEIGAILLRKTEKVRQSTRVEFLCGSRAIRRARADYEALAKTGQILSCGPDDVAAGVAMLSESAKTADKARRKLELDLAVYEGRALYDSTGPGPDGIRRATRDLSNGSLEGLRALAQSFTAHPRAVFIATLADPPSLLVASSEDSGVDAGALLKSVLSEAGGRGGGNARLAQGSVRDLESVKLALARISPFR